MDWGDLRVFEAVARSGSMNRAAAELNTVQSNVTARVRLLEELLGVALFERHSRGVILTAAGQRLLPYASRIGLLLQEAGRAARDDGQPQGTLLVGSLETTAALRLPPVLAAYTSRHPQVDLVLRTGTMQSLVADVLEQRLEGAFVAGPVDHPQLIETAVFREELVLITAPAIRSIAQLAEVQHLKLIVFRVGCAYRQRLEALLAGRGIVNLRPLEFGTLDGILGCVAAGIGVTLLPQAAAQAAARDGKVRLHRLDSAAAAVDTVFIHHRQRLASSALKALLDTARRGGMQPARRHLEK